MTPVLPNPNGSAGDPSAPIEARRLPVGVRLLLQKILPLPNAVRTSALLFGEGASVGLLLWATIASSLTAYSLENDITPGERKVLIASMLGSGLVALLVSLVFLIR